MTDLMSAEERAAAAGLWLREARGAEARVVDGVMLVPTDCAPSERDAAVADALAIWLCSVAPLAARAG